MAPETTATPVNRDAPAYEQTKVEEKVIGKMSVKALGCNPKLASAKPPEDNTPVKMCVIFGAANGTKTWEDKRNGQVYSCLIGDFKGINMTTGESYRSGKLFLPGGIHETVEAAVIGDGTNEKTVEFALEIHAVRATNPIGYAYQGIPRIRAVVADPLSRIEQMIRQQIALPAPPVQTAQLQAPAAPQLQAPAAPAALMAPETQAVPETQAAPAATQQRQTRRR